MTLLQEASSWRSPKAIQLSPIPQIGNKAPSCPELSLPTSNAKPTIIAFLRHCGCPVAEATFLELRKTASERPDINFIAVSHSDRPSTDRWVDAFGGTTESGSSSDGVTVIVDFDRKIYALWGLGITPWNHVLSPMALLSIISLGRQKGIWNRPTESGTRWQSGGFWAVDGSGIVRWGRPAARADDRIKVEQAVKALDLE